MDDKNNSGNYNSGSCNSGSYNSGSCNSGNHNSGSYNSGSYNSGSYNSGVYNSGNHNSGSYNSGSCNSGSYNSGVYNSGNRNSGFFCTETTKPMFFDVMCDMTWEEAINIIPYVELPVCCEWIKSSNMTVEEKTKFSNYTTLGGYLKSTPMKLTESFPQAWSKMNKEEKQKWLDLPNFNAEKFLKITGVDVGAKPTCEGRVVIIDGIEYKLVLKD